MKRLPVLLLIAVGAWLFSSGYLPKDRELSWTVERPQLLRFFEVQLYAPDGGLVKREERSFPTGARGDFVQTVKLGTGSYRARVFTRYEGDSAIRHVEVPLEITREDRYVLKVPR